jgi:hypothetical protein
MKAAPVSATTRAHVCVRASGVGSQKVIWPP